MIQSNESMKLTVCSWREINTLLGSSYEIVTSLIHFGCHGGSSSLHAFITSNQAKSLTNHRTVKKTDKITLLSIGFYDYQVYQLIPILLHLHLMHQRLPVVYRCKMPLLYVSIGCMIIEHIPQSKVFRIFTISLLWLAINISKWLLSFE